MFHEAATVFLDVLGVGLGVLVLWAFAASGRLLGEIAAERRAAAAYRLERERNRLLQARVELYAVPNPTMIGVRIRMRYGGDVDLAADLGKLVRRTDAYLPGQLIKGVIVK